MLADAGLKTCCLHQHHKGSGRFVHYWWYLSSVGLFGPVAHDRVWDAHVWMVEGVAEGHMLCYIRVQLDRSCAMRGFFKHPADH